MIIDHRFSIVNLCSPIDQLTRNPTAHRHTPHSSNPHTPLRPKERLFSAVNPLEAGHARTVTTAGRRPAHRRASRQQPSFIEIVNCPAANRDHRSKDHPATFTQNARSHRSSDRGRVTRAMQFPAASRITTGPPPSKTRLGVRPRGGTRCGSQPKAERGHAQGPAHPIPTFSTNSSRPGCPAYQGLLRSAALRSAALRRAALRSAALRSAAPHPPPAGVAGDA
jgi:hypothetical protein